MTVNEVETRTGLDRATVRYYESQGLVSPARERNGYRSYSEADVQKLQKVRLLRALEFSIEDIRSMDADGSDFPDRLRARIRSLEAKSDSIEDAKRVIAKMLDDRAQYGTLKSEAYLADLTERGPVLPEPDPLPEPKPGPEDHAVPVSPWRRFFARWFDRGLCSIFVTWLVLGVFHIPSEESYAIINIIFNYILPICAVILLEPLALCTLGATPGKLLLGLRVRANDGRRLDFGTAFRRTCGVLGAGEGLFVPILRLLRNWASYRDLKAGETLYWEYDSRVEAKRGIAWYHCTAFIAAVAVSANVAAIVVSIPYMTKNRGALTPGELAENVNAGGSIYGWVLTEDGGWERSGRVPTYDGSSEYWSWEPADVDLTVENGRVTGLSYRASGNTNAHYYRIGTGYDMAIILRLAKSLVCADRREFKTVSAVDSFTSELDSVLNPEKPTVVTRGPWTVTVTFTVTVNRDGPTYPFELTLTVEHA